jgi:hypothetical protein|tara:strand:- start:4890 stop:5180 length:291 start_codon:yes stop_codon:yes gene_type:complete
MARILVLGLMLVTAPAWAASPTCGLRGYLLAYLATQYGERPLVSVISVNGYTLEIVASHKGTWTLIKTVPGKLPCVIDSGTGVIKPMPPPPDKIKH